MYFVNRENFFSLAIPVRHSSSSEFRSESHSITFQLLHSPPLFCITCHHSEFFLEIFTFSYQCIVSLSHWPHLNLQECPLDMFWPLPQPPKLCTFHMRYQLRRRTFEFSLKIYVQYLQHYILCPTNTIG